MIFQVLGPVEVHGHDGRVRELGRGKAATTLATLLLHPNAWVTSAELIDAIWHETAVPDSAVANLKTYVWRLRRVLLALCPDEGGPRIESAPGRYRLRTEPEDLDSHHVARHSATARAAMDAGEQGTAADALEAALSLWRGRPFEGVAGAAVAREADRLAELRLQLREELAETRLAAGDAAEAVRALRALTDDDPLREGAWARLVRALHAQGRRAEAVRAYRQARYALAAELGVCPGSALDAAYRAVLGEGAGTTGPRRELPRTATHFAARKAESAAIRGARGGVVLVHGMPGVGKTALAVHAAHQLASAYPGGQIFVDLRAYAAEGALEPAEVLARLLRRAGVVDAALPDSVGERAALWRSELANRRVLVVLDDAEGIGQVEPLLPAGRSSLTLVTTRNRDWHVDGALRLGLGPLADGDAAGLFRAAAGLGAAAAVDAVTRHCGGVPAALRDVAARLRTRPTWTVDSLARELRGPCQVLGCARDGYRDALARSFTRLTPVQRAAMSAVGDLPGEFELTTAARLLDGTPEAVRVTLESLVDAGLLDALPDERYGVHELVRHFARCRDCAPAGVGGRAVRAA